MGSREMNYEQKYKEALALARSYYSDDTNAYLIDLFPELAENEDERIRKEIIGYLNSKVATAEETELLYFKHWIAYLEKQKPQDQCVDVIKMSALLAADRLASAEMTGRLKERKEILENPEKYGLCKPVEKQKEQKHPNGCFTCDEYKKGYEAGRSNGFTAGYNKAMKEQKPVDEPFEEWIDGWYNEHHRDGYITMDEREFKNFCRGIKNIYQQKPAEWSEEDEKNLENIKIYLLHHGEDSWADTIIKLKSLRPSWKPSEEKVKPLRNVPPIESTMK